MAAKTPTDTKEIPSKTKGNAGNDFQPITSMNTNA